MYYDKLAAFLVLVRIGAPAIEMLEQLAEPEEGARDPLAETALKILQYERD
jgi:hypothetical protein